jgi:hypothetical protein
MFKNHLQMIGFNETPNKKAKFWQSYIRSLKGKFLMSCGLESRLLMGLYSDLFWALKFGQFLLTLVAHWTSRSNGLFRLKCPIGFPKLTAFTLVPYWTIQTDHLFLTLVPFWDLLEDLFLSTLLDFTNSQSKFWS